MEDTGPRIHMATVKLPDGSQEADNFWREGNTLCAVDIQSGKLGPSVGIEKISDNHPLTDNRVAGYAIPDWRQLCDSVLYAASLLPGIETQGWDVALTSKGPILLELNFGGDLNLHQIAHQKGILGSGYIEHLRNCGYRGKLPPVE